MFSLLFGLFSLLFLGLASVMLIASSLWMLYEGARVSVLWLLAMLVFPVFGLIFGVVHFERSKGWIALTLAGLAALFISTIATFPL